MQSLYVAIITANISSLYSSSSSFIILTFWMYKGYNIKETLLNLYTFFTVPLENIYKQLFVNCTVRIFSLFRI